MNKVFMIGIAGGSGSGKTSFLRELMSYFTSNEIAFVSQDNYYKPKSEQVADQNGVINFDLPTSINRKKFASDMEQLKLGNPLQLLEYNFNNPEMEPKTIIVAPAPVIIIEGLFVFHYEEILSSLDYKVYIDAHHEERYSRRIKRDEKERGYPAHEIHYQWENHVRPSEVLYLEPYIPQCDLIVDNTLHFAQGLDKLVEMINILIPHK